MPPVTVQAPPLNKYCRGYHKAPQDFATIVILPVLKNLTFIPYSKDAAQLLLGTALTESGGLKHRTQYPTGPARGLFQMEVATHNDIWDNYLKYRKDLADQVKEMMVFSGEPNANELISNDNYAAAMCRVHYHRMAGVLPAYGNIEAQAKTWKQYYNTPRGKGTTKKYLDDWKAHGGDKVTF